MCLDSETVPKIELQRDVMLGIAVAKKPKIRVHGRLRWPWSLLLAVVAQTTDSA